MTGSTVVSRDETTRQDIQAMVNKLSGEQLQAAFWRIEAILTGKVSVDQQGGHKA